MITSTSIFNHTFNQRVCNSLEKDQLVRHKFPVWGTLHIDRRLPFLCIYRQPHNRDDAGTEQLLLGQASYILIREQDADCEGFLSLIAEIMKVLSKHYSNALLFELWSEDVIDYQLDNIEQQPIVISIKTTKHHAPLHMLEHLESALLEVPIKFENISIKLNYSDKCQPPNMMSLGNNSQFNPVEASNNTYFWVGLGLNSVYRNSTELFPYILRDVQRWITQVLRRSFFIFTDHYTQHKPAHHHQLGRRSLTNAVKVVDKSLSDIKQQFELLFHVTPVNSDEAWKEFKESQFSNPPSFNYRPRPIEPDLLKRRLYNIPIENIEDPTLSFIFHSQRDEVDRQLTMISDRNKPNFLYESIQVYGSVEPWLLNIAHEVLSELEPENMAESVKSISATEFTRRAEKLYALYQKQAPDMTNQIIIRDDIPGILVSKGNLMIGRHSRFLESRVAGTLAHEVGTHVLTHINGKSQPFNLLHSGMANYEPLQEGLAILAEYLVGELSSERLRRLAARVLAVDSLIKGAEFIDVFRLLHSEHHFSSYQAYYITMRVFRGGGFTKDMIYLKGFSQLLDYLIDGGELDILYLGKIAQHDIPFVDELRWRKVLKDGPLQPHFLTTQKSKQLMKTIRNGLSIKELIQELKS